MRQVAVSLLLLTGAKLAAGLGIAGRSPARSSRQAEAVSFVRSLEFKQTLRVCNAYPYDSGVDIFVGSEQLSSESLPYKSCKEYSPKLHPGDKVDFKVDGSSAGTFTISDLPASDATLLMVISRHDTMSTAVSFESHVFSKTAESQVAVIDTYKGKSGTELRIEDVKPHKAGDAPEDKKHAFVARSEMLRYNNVVAVNPGIYKVKLMAEKGVKAENELVAVPEENYVILRVGVDAEEGKTYGEELVVFPHSDKKMFESGASPLGGLQSWLFSIVALIAALHCGC